MLIKLAFRCIHMNALEAENGSPQKKYYMINISRQNSIRNSEGFSYLILKLKQRDDMICSSTACLIVLFSSHRTWNNKFQLRLLETFTTGTHHLLQKADVFTFAMCVASNPHTKNIWLCSSLRNNIKCNNPPHAHCHYWKKQYSVQRFLLYHNWNQSACYRTKTRSISSEN